MTTDLHLGNAPKIATSRPRHASVCAHTCVGEGSYPLSDESHGPTEQAGYRTGHVLEVALLAQVLGSELLASWVSGLLNPRWGEPVSERNLSPSSFCIPNKSIKSINKGWGRGDFSSCYAVRIVSI